MSARASIHAMFPLDEAATTVLNQRLDAHRVEVLREAMRLIDAHPHPGDHPVSFYCGLLEGLLPDAGEEATAEAATATPDTLANWLYLRFSKSAVAWEDLDLVDREYWEHEVQAVRRAVVRGGFRTNAEGGSCG